MLSTAAFESLGGREVEQPAHLSPACVTPRPGHSYPFNIATGVHLASGLEPNARDWPPINNYEDGTDRRQTLIPSIFKLGLGPRTTLPLYRRLLAFGFIWRALAVHIAPRPPRPHPTSPDQSDATCPRRSIHTSTFGRAVPPFLGPRPWSLRACSVWTMGRLLSHVCPLRVGEQQNRTRWLMFNDRNGACAYRLFYRESEGVRDSEISTELRCISLAALNITHHRLPSLVRWVIPFYHYPFLSQPG
jgi:hypothetical protein